MVVLYLPMNQNFVLLVTHQMNSKMAKYVNLTALFTFTILLKDLISVYQLVFIIYMMEINVLKNVLIMFLLVEKVVLHHVFTT